MRAVEREKIDRKGGAIMEISFKNYELIMALVLIISVIFMVLAFIKVTIEGEED